MADSASESDSSSIDGGPIMMPPSPVTREQLHKRIESLQQQNRVYKVELETYKLRVKALQEENRHLRQASVNIQAKAEQEEEFISNTLLKKIQALKKEKETLAHHYEQEEECLTNDLSRKLNQLRAEKCKLEQTLEQEQECLVNKLMRKIEKLEAETVAKQTNLEQLRREKVELENTLEQEQEALVNRLWKRMDKLEAEKRNLQNKVELGYGLPPGASGNNSVGIPGAFLRNETSSVPLSLQHPNSQSGQLPPRPGSDVNDNKGTMSLGSESRGSALETDVITLSSNVQHLRNEVDRLKAQLNIAQQQHADKMAQFAMEERTIRDENLRLQRRLQLEMERREALCRHLSESESSLEMEDERHFHESLVAQSSPAAGNTGSGMMGSHAGILPIPSSSAGAPGVVPSSALPIRPRQALVQDLLSCLHLDQGLQLSCGGSASRDVIMSPPSPVSRCHMCNGHGFLVGGNQGGPLVVTTSQSSGPFSNVVSSSSPPIRHSSRERFARPAPPSNDRPQEPRTPGDSNMSSPAPSPSPLEVVMSPNAAPSPSPSPMDISKT
ncbi:Coiled-coil domain-containing protein 6 [Orchesella cincta]|uniref:Coiled-coil domain-containing protein 6 n=1 Tax=Orchesella cincta TaxID=48709 RepID=A0A1D2M7T9_ORCCI|nr:Coiled-coil domain-containing protein 6 [Orchesella cincta]